MSILAFILFIISLSKLFLVMSFNKDTIEEIASDFYTNLPIDTIKVIKFFAFIILIDSFAGIICSLYLLT